MSWKDQNALLKIFNVFKRNKKSVYESDVEAFKHICDTITNYELGFAHDNLLFCKLLAYMLRMNLIHFGDMKTSVMHISDIMKRTLPSEIELLKMQLNNTEIKNYLVSIGIDFEKYTDQPEILNSKQKQIIEKINKSWDFKSVSTSFINTAEGLIKNVNNYG